VYGVLALNDEEGKLLTFKRLPDGYPAIAGRTWTSTEEIMRLRTTGLGLITLGVLLLGAQLVLYLGAKNVHPPPDSGEMHIAPPPEVRTTPLPGIFGMMSLVIGFALAVRKPEEADDPRDGLTIPGEGEKVRHRPH
jgi:hypothetical protein